MTTHIEVWIYPQCMASAVTGPLDVFAVANAIWQAQTTQRHKQAKPAGSALFSWSLYSPDGKPVATPTGISLIADARIDEVATIYGKADVILLPGIFVGNGSSGLFSTLRGMQDLYPILRKKYQEGSALASNCSATFVLAEAGLLDGGHATTTWWLERTFKKRYPKVDLRPTEVVDEYQRILTTGAATTYLNLALLLVERYGGQELAASVAKTLLIDANRSSQMPYMSLTQQDVQVHRDPLVLRAQKWMRQHGHVAFSLQQLADHLAVSDRTVIRHFHQALATTPGNYAQQLKMDHAKRLLETTTLSLDQVSDRTGYADPGSFRRSFKRHTGLSPADYRQQFRQRSAVSTANEVGGDTSVSKSITTLANVTFAI